MGTIFVVSPTYLEAIFEESKKYNFDLQGYGSFKLACDGIIKTNCSDIVGFAFVGTHLPYSKSKDFKFMLEFFSMINLFPSSKKFVIATDSGASSWQKVFSKYSNIRFFAAQPYDFMSDIVINKSVFGSILLDASKPYELKPRKSEPFDWVSPKLEYVPLFSDAQIQCASSVETLDTLERTLDNDAVYLRFKNDSAYLKSFRFYFIALKLHDQDAIAQGLLEVNSILEEQSNDTSTWCALIALKDYIERNAYE